MSLTILTTNEEQLSGATLCGLVKKDVQQGDVVVLVPSFAEVLQVQRSLANEGLSLGIHVGTPQSWLRDLWDVWGDGRRIVDTQMRTLLITQLLEQEVDRLEQEGKQGRQAISPTPGTTQLLCDLAQRGLPWVKEGLKNTKDLTTAEYRLASLLDLYEQMLANKNLVEGVTCACEICTVLKEVEYRMPYVLLAGFNELNGADLALVTRVMRLAHVDLIVRMCNALAHKEACRVAELLASHAQTNGVPVRRIDAAKTEQEAACGSRSSELQELLNKLFIASSNPIESTGAVRLLEPSGALSQMELVSREVMSLAKSGKQNAAVVVPDVRSAWRELAPKLIARGVNVHAQLSIPVLCTESGRAFMGYARTVAQLMRLAMYWPAPVESESGSLVRLGNMEWWPPRELVDFLLNDMSRVGPKKAHTLDIAWRSNRLLSPSDVLLQLTSAKATSSVVERATRELMRGRLGSAASKLLAPYVDEGAADPSVGTKEVVSLVREETVGVLEAVIGVASTLKEMGIYGDTHTQGSVDLITLVNRAELILRSTRVTLRPKASASQGFGSVLLLGRSQAAALAPASVDVAVLCGLTSEEYKVPSCDNELAGMLEALGIEEPRDMLSIQRAQFWRLCSLPRTQLLLERTMFTADSFETYPAVMLSEVLSCYRSKLPCVALAEDAARANLSAGGMAPHHRDVEPVAAAGYIDDANRRLVIVPQEGQEELVGGLPVLSASQLESYLECPLKWFSLRRLRLGDNDAGFGPLEMGTFAHRVLELTYRQLFEEGRAQLDPRDTEGMAHAHEVLNSCFSTHLEHQYIKSGTKGVYQALVAHSSWEESHVERLRRDLLSSLDYAAQRLQGYEPRAFEWEFGRGNRTAEQDGLPALPQATYAGVQVTGTVDRIDINNSGQAIIIDYKHKGPVGFFAEYAVFGKKSYQEGEFVLPRRIQALLYAQVVRRAFPDLKVVGALYLGTRGTHELSGAIEQSQANAAFGGMLGPRRANQVTVLHNEDFGQQGKHGMEALLDATEQAIARKIERLRGGHIEAEPIDAAACSYCPVLNCERRLQ